MGRALNLKRRPPLQAARAAWIGYPIRGREDCPGLPERPYGLSPPPARKHRPLQPFSSSYLHRSRPTHAQYIPWSYVLQRKLLASSNENWYMTRSRWQKGCVERFENCFIDQSFIYFLGLCT